MGKRILLGVIASVCLWGFIAGIVGAAEQEDIGQGGQEQQQQIRAYIAQRQREIEQFYAGRAVELQMRAQAEINRLEVAEATGFVIVPEWAALKAAGTVLEINGFSSGHCGYYESQYVRPPQRLRVGRSQVERLVLARTKIADAISLVQTRLEWGLAGLERQKAYALTVELPEVERRLSEGLFEPLPQAPAGVVTGILHSKDTPAAIIGGFVVHRSEELNGVKIIEIHPDRVEFEKAGRRWQQKVQAQPAVQWQ